jgi:hypothetical protein
MKKIMKPLALRREAIRSLSEHQIGAVIGGIRGSANGTRSASCPSTPDATCQSCFAGDCQ